ncbi:hypothetical protein Hdeb2414_s0002g00047371 [Helianthus debilis subsp. tardiflorus]
MLDCRSTPYIMTHSRFLSLPLIVRYPHTTPNATQRKLSRHHQQVPHLRI